LNANVKSFPSHWAAMISVSLALSQTSVYTAKTTNPKLVTRAVHLFMSHV